MSDPDLKACPFCGCPDVEYHNGWFGGSKEAHIEKTGDPKPFRSPSVSCSDCGAAMVAGSFGWGVSDATAEAETKKLWNHRQAEYAPESNVTNERLVGVLRSFSGISNEQLSDSEILERVDGTLMLDTARLQGAIEDLGACLRSELREQAEKIESAVSRVCGVLGRR